MDEWRGEVQNSKQRIVPFSCRTDQNPDRDLSLTRPFKPYIAGICVFIGVQIVDHDPITNIGLDLDTITYFDLDLVFDLDLELVFDLVRNLSFAMLS